MAYIYLYHLERPLGRPQTPEQRELHGLPPRQNGYKAHAAHYCGIAKCLATRDHQHQVGGRAAAAMLRAAKRRGISYRIVRVWLGDEELEKRLKRRKEAPKLCPICAERPLRLQGVEELAPEEIEQALIPF